MDNLAREIFKLLKTAVWIFMIIFAGLCVFVFDVDISMILSWMPKSLWLSALMLLSLYALKSITFVVPIMLLEIAGGCIFPLPIAIAVNLAGVIIDLTLPYIIGYRSGTEKVGVVLEKYPDLKKAVSRQKENSAAFCYLMYVLPMMPSDVASMYFGAVRVPYYKSVLCGLASFVPKMLLAVIFGASIQQKGTTGYIVSVALTIIMYTTVAVGYLYYLKKTGGRLALPNKKHADSTEDQL